MRVPNVPERMKEAPAHALRAVFAGIGQALLLSDRMRRRFRDDGEEPPQAAQPVTARPTAAAAPPAPAAAAPAAEPAPVPGPAPAPKPAAAPSAKPAATPSAKPAAAPKPAPAVKPAAKPAANPAARPAAKPAAAAGPAASPRTAAAAPSPASAAASGTAPAASQPFQNYDELSVASLRARMRGLNVSQLRELIGYERAHAARGDVIAMFERRITKLEATGG